MARRMRTCIACMQEDTAPKDIVATPDGSNGGADVYWHFDCHSIATGCKSCTQAVKDSGGAQNDDLVEFLTGERP